MFFLGSLSAVDPSLGRVDKSSFSQQTLMELVISGITTNKHMICGDSERPKELSEWTGLDLDDPDEVIVVLWDDLDLDGLVDIQWLPETMESFSVSQNGLSQRIELAQLPASLLELDLSSNDLFGEISLEELPAGLLELYLEKNRLSGTLNLERLPKSLKFLHLSNNEFTGTVCLTELPETLKILNLGDNMLSGCIDVTKLPNGIDRLYLSKNRFDGLTDFSKLPDSLLLFDIAETNLSGDIRAKNRAYYMTAGSKVTLI